MNQSASSPDFQEIYQSFYPSIRRYLQQLAGPQDAEDLTQETFIKVSQALHTFRQDAQLSTWIYRIATHTAIDRSRKPAIQRESPHAPDLLPPFPTRASSAPLPPSLEEQTIQKEMSSCIRSVIHQLPEKYRTIITLSELEGFKLKEIALILDISLPAAKARLLRGKTQLKQSLMQRCRFSRDERNEFVCEPKTTGSLQ